MSTRAIILAGGRGTRLHPYTVVFPKPLVPVGDVPILEIVIRQLRQHGIREITLAVGHLAELLHAYFGDGSRWDVEITYSRETEPLGTAGPLSLVGALDETFIVMNGDVLTTLDYTDLLNFHRTHGGVATIATHARTVRIDLGVVEVDAAQRLTNYVEKPTFEYRVSMGIYVFEPSVLKNIAPKQRLDFPDLVLGLLKNEQAVYTYQFDGYWLDIGRPDDYAEANAEFERLRAQFLPGESKEQP